MTTVLAGTRARRSIRAIAVIVATIAACVSLCCHALGPKCFVHNTPQGDFISVEGRYTIVLCRPDFMTSVFGPGWNTQQLYYGVTPSVSSSGELITARTPLTPIAFGSPMFIIAGPPLEDVSLFVYVLESHQMVELSVDTRRSRLSVSKPLSPRRGNAVVLDDKTLALE